MAARLRCPGFRKTAPELFPMGNANDTVPIAPWLIIVSRAAARK